MDELVAGTTLERLEDRTPERLLADEAQREAKQVHGSERVLCLVYHFRASGVSLWKDMTEPVHSDFLHTWVCRDAILREETSVRVIVAVEVHHAQAQRTQ